MPRGQLHSVNKRISGLRSQSAERLAKRQEVIGVVARPRPARQERSEEEEWRGRPVLARAVAR